MTRPAAPLPGTVQVWSDIACPWATLALVRLRAARAELGLELDVRVEHRAFPLELANGTPLAPTDGEALEVLGGEGAGASAGDAAGEGAAGEDAFPVRRWSGEHGPWPSSVLTALAAVRAAGTGDEGEPVGERLAAAEELDWALRRALLSESRPIGSDEEVLAVAADVPGLDSRVLRERLDAGRELVRADWALVPELDIKASPHLRLADGTSVVNPGADDSFDWGDLLRRALAVEG